MNDMRRPVVHEQQHATESAMVSTMLSSMPPTKGM
eukprot:CAMPEP_0170632210 /NCGR_PEP_ID=MMETSP0224-20130122/35184_1 /TAXON_ID=285029 /ORGANISM="Togula jolla, Strain CCCM 725" /LENGTH=34 /DNA_ID= /DNA_START= /DNA_END= /DNA_ORIENTATION=